MRTVQDKRCPKNKLPGFHRKATEAVSYDTLFIKLWKRKQKARFLISCFISLTCESRKMEDGSENRLITYSKYFKNNTLWINMQIQLNICWFSWMSSAEIWNKTITLMCILNSSFPRWSERSKLTNESVKSEWFCVYSPRKSRITLQFLSANLQHAQAILFKGKSAFFPLTAEHLKLLFTGEFNSAKVLLEVNLTCISCRLTGRAAVV